MFCHGSAGLHTGTVGISPGLLLPMEVVAVGGFLVLGDGGWNIFAVLVVEEFPRSGDISSRQPFLLHASLLDFRIALES